MKKGHLHLLGRKKQTLFDTSVKMKEMDNVELVLGSSAVPESGTASVRARPTVKHHSSSESFHGFAVPTPKVPLLPQLNSPKTNGSVAGDQMPNGFSTSVPDLVEGEIFSPPPPPSIAPPPPPSTAPPLPPSTAPPPLPMSFILPPPEFMGDLNSPEMAALQPPSMAPPNLHFLPPSTEERDLALLQPPTMAPPKPPSTSSSGSASSISNSSLPPAKVPEPPKFAPPQTPSEKQSKTHKTPPPKPIRSSSVSSLDSPPHTPAPPPPVQTPTLSTFNPQNTAKLYNVPKTTVLGGYEGHDTRPKQVLVLEDSGSVNPVPVLVHGDGKAPKVATPPAAAPKDETDMKENLQLTQPSQILPPELHVEAKTGTVSAQSEVTKLPKSPQLQKGTSIQVNSEKIPDSPQLQKGTSIQVNSEKIPDSPQLQKGTSIQVNSEKIPDSPQLQKGTSIQVNSEKIPDSPQLQKGTSIQVNSEKIPDSPQLQKGTSIQVNSETSKDKLDGSPSQSRSFSPMLDHKLRHLKANEINGGREGPAASPLTLLMAAKEREKQRTTQSLSPEDSTKKNEEPSRSIHQSYSSPSSSVIPNSVTSSSQTPPEERLHESNASLRSMEHPKTIQTSEKVSTTQSNSQAPSRIPPDSSPAVSSLTEPKQSTEQSPSMSQAVQHDEQKEDNMLLLPPPPEFDDLEDMIEPPPFICPPDPPLKNAATPSPAPPPPPAPASVPPPPPKLPPSDIDIKPKAQVQTKPKLAPTQLPPTLSPSQTTLLSILQKKMLEMDQKVVAEKEVESITDDWGTTLSEEDNKVPVAVRVSPKAKTYPAVNKTATLDMRELENKVIKKYQDSQVKKFPTSNGPHSKSQYGKTFTIRPGTKQPITLVTKED